MAKKSLKNYFWLTIILVTIALFTIFFIFSSSLHTSLTISENKKISNAISKQVFNSMYEVMRKGWTRDDLQSFLSHTKSSFEESSYEVDIYRSKNVEALYGKIEQDIHTDVLTVFETKNKLEEEKGNTLRIINPILAKNECLQCHTNVKEGDVLGAVEIYYDYSEVISQSMKKYFLFSLIILPFVALIAFFITRFFFRKIDLSINEFQTKIENINSVKDFKNIDTSNIKQTFVEFDSMMLSINELASKLKNIAVDKNILEFEVKLLDKMVITSEVIKDWKEYIKDLLFEINEVLPVYCLITIFKANEDLYEIEIFWKGIPPDNVRNHLDKIAKEMIKQHHHLDISDCTITHNISNRSLKLDHLTEDDIEHEAKSLFLDSPKIGGIVGLVIQSNTTKDSIFSIVVDSILTTLLNLVGSIKAINKYTESLEFYATRDPLTGLFSQRVFRDLLTYEVKRAHRHNYEFGILVIDCDNFKPINDIYGHSFGDDFLKEFASILVQSKRDEDILSRYGGDEFTIILPECNEEDAYKVANRIIENVNNFELLAPDGKLVRVTVSIGLSLYPEHSEDEKELFNIADAMMYKAKNEGKNSVRTPNQEDIEEIYNDNKDKSLYVLEAIKKQSIYPHFQPIMDVKTNSIQINELLMRIDVENSVITAGVFIETAESLGVVHQMDYIVIEKAFKYMKEENYQGILFINLSPKALIVAEFIEKIDALAHKYEINKQKIVFEITERETVKSFAMLEKFVHNLKLEGFSFAIDDFGSGFSTFHYIKKFPIDYIKIDGDFIVNIKKDKKDLAFVKSIVSLAKDLNVKTVAEFVEDEEILDFLREIEVDFVQGYHIGKPSKELIVR